MFFIWCTVTLGTICGLTACDPDGGEKLVIQNPSAGKEMKNPVADSNTTIEIGITEPVIVEKDSEAMGESTVRIIKNAPQVSIKQKNQ